MLFFGPTSPTQDPHAQLLGTLRPVVNLRGPLGATAWVRQTGKFSNTECRYNPNATTSLKTMPGMECRPYVAPGAAPDSGIVALQRALVVLGQNVSVDGKIGAQTRSALANVLPSIGNAIDGDLKYPVLALAVVVLTGKGDSTIVSIAPELAVALNTYALVNSGVTPDVGAGAPNYPAASGSPWYTQTSGKIAIGIGAALVLLLVLRK